MSEKTSIIMTRVEPAIKEQAEAVLNQLGISMSAAMSMFLRQIALQRKIPFEIALPSAQPTSLSQLTDDQFNMLMETAIQSYTMGKCTDLADFWQELGLGCVVK